MNSADRLLRLFDFDAWSNREVLAILKEQESFEQHKKVMSLFSHVLAAEELWYLRISNGDLSQLKVWPSYTLDVIENMIDDFSDAWPRLINENEADPDRIISYKNTSGTAYNTMLSDILHHVVIHGQHHRAQIATLLRQSGITPPPTDFIFYTRAE